MIVAGEASEMLVVLEKLNGDGIGENAFSELADVDGEPQPKKLPSLDELGDFGSGLSVLGVLISEASGCESTC